MVALLKEFEGFMQIILKNKNLLEQKNEQLLEYE